MYVNRGYPFPPGEYYRLKNAQTGYYLDIPGASTSNIYPVKQFPHTGGNNQLWYLNRYSGDICAFTPTHRPNSYLNVYMAYTNPGTEIGVYGQSSASNNSRWRVIPNLVSYSDQRNGTYRLEASYALGMVAKAINNSHGAPIQLMGYSGNNMPGPTYFDEWIFHTSGNVPVSLENRHNVGSDRQLGLNFSGVPNTSDKPSCRRRRLEQSPQRYPRRPKRSIQNRHHD